MRKSIEIDHVVNLGVYYDFEKFLTGCTLPQALDHITIAGRVLRICKDFKVMRELQNFVSEVFDQECLMFTVDHELGIHPLVDEEFQRSKGSAIVALEVSGNNAAKYEFERAFDFLTGENPDYKSAIRSVFEVAEILVKEALGTKNLSEHVLTVILKPKLEETCGGDDVSLNVHELIINQAVSWVNACHYYRHGQVTDGPYQPLAETAILLISNGSNFIRWFLDIRPRISAGQALEKR